MTHPCPGHRTPVLLFTVSLARPGSAVLTEHIDLLRAAARAMLVAHPVEVLAWVVLPDHMHAVWRLGPGDDAVARRWGRLKAAFTRRLRHRLGDVAPAAGEVWRPGVRWRRCLDAEDAAWAVHACWADPVRHGLVAAATDWAASSIHRDRRLGRVPADWTRPGVPSLSRRAA